MGDIKKLELGCGKTKKEGYLGLDKYDYPGVDITMDLEQDNLVIPFPDDYLDEIYTNHTLEHIDGPKRLFVVDECYRILRSGGVFEIHSPHESCRTATSYYGHKFPPINEDSFRYFCKDYQDDHFKYWHFDGVRSRFVQEYVGTYTYVGVDPDKVTMIKFVLRK